MVTVRKYEDGGIYVEMTEQELRALTFFLHGWRQGSDVHDIYEPLREYCISDEGFMERTEITSAERN